MFKIVKMTLRFKSFKIKSQNYFFFFLKLVPRLLPIKSSHEDVEV